MDFSTQLLKMTKLYFSTLMGSLIMPFILIAGIFVLRKVKVQNIGTLKNYEKVNFITHLIINSILIFSIIFLFVNSPNLYKDLLNVVNKKYIIDECVVIGQDMAGPIDVAETRGVILKSLKTGDEFSFTAYYTPMGAGECYKVIYWANCKIGSIIERIG